MWLFAVAEAFCELGRAQVCRYRVTAFRAVLVGPAQRYLLTFPNRAGFSRSGGAALPRRGEPVWTGRCW